MSEEFNQAMFELKYQLRRYRRLLWAAVVFVVVVFAVGTLFYSIAPDEEGVVLRFGEHVNTTAPGLHMKLPWPIDEVRPVPVQKIRTLEFGFHTQGEAGRVTHYGAPTNEEKRVAEMLTGDLNLAHVEWIVQYRIDDAYQYLFKLGGESSQQFAVEETIRDTSESVIRRLVGDVSVDEVLTFGRDRIAGQAKMELQELLNRFESGVNVVAVKLQTVSPPDPVKDAFDSVNRARQNKERVINEAKGKRNALIPAARGERDRVIAESEGYRERVVRTAQGRANAFLAQLKAYRTAPEVTRSRMYLETMEDLLQNVEEKLVIDESVRGLVPLLDLNSQSSRRSEEGGQR